MVNYMVDVNAQMIVCAVTGYGYVNKVARRVFIFCYIIYLYVDLDP